jgi:hypothetical protein
MVKPSNLTGLSDQMNDLSTKFVPHYIQQFRIILLQPGNWHGYRMMLLDDSN